MSSTDRPHVFLIVLDAARADHMSCYGHTRDTTPNLDSLAQRGHRYRNAWSGATWTLPSVATLFTGSYPSRHGTSRRQPFLDTPLPTLAEIFRRGHYETFAVSNNSWISSGTKFSRGFQRFDKVWQLVQDHRDVLNDRMVGVFSKDGFGGKDLVKALAGGNAVKNALNTFYGRFFYKKGDSGAAKLNRHVRSWLERRDHSDPSFVFLHYLEPHLPFHPPEPWKSRFLSPSVTKQKLAQVNLDAWAYVAGRAIMTDEDLEIFAALYDAEIAYLDHRLGELFSMLDDKRMFDDSMIVVTADHGENLGEHGLLDHQYSIHETLLHVPLVVKMPGQTLSAVVHDDLVHNFDSFATAVETAGLTDPVADQRDAVPLPVGTGSRERSYLFAEYPEPQPRTGILERRFPGFNADHLDCAYRAVRSRRFKFVLSSRGKEELFDLEKDPGENESVLSRHPEEASELRAALLAKFDVLGPQGGGEGPGMEALDPEMRGRLEALGYLS